MCSLPVTNHEGGDQLQPSSGMDPGDPCLWAVSGASDSLLKGERGRREDIMRYHSQYSVLERPWLPSWGLPLLSLTSALSLLLSQFACAGEADFHAGSSLMERPVWLSKHWSPHPHRPWGTGACQGHVSASGPLPIQLPDETTALAGCLTTTSWKTLNQRPPDKLCTDSWCTETVR